MSDSSQQPPHTISGAGAIPSGEAFGEVDVGLVLSLSTYVAGYSDALERFRAAAADSSRPPDETFKPLFEALNWALSIDDYWLRSRRPKLRERLLFATRFARNRAVHGWASILDLRDEPAPGITVTLASAGRAGGALASGHLVRHWYWRNLAELPRAPRRHRRGEDDYRDLLSGKSVQPTLDDLEAIFNTL